MYKFNLYFCLASCQPSTLQRLELLLVVTWVPNTSKLCFFPGARGRWRAWKISNSLEMTQQLLTFFCDYIVSCKSGNSSVWPRRSWKLASSVKTDPSVTLRKASIKTQTNWLLCHLLKFLSRTTLSPLSTREVAPQIFVCSFPVDLAFSYGKRGCWNCILLPPSSLLLAGCMSSFSSPS